MAHEIEILGGTAGSASFVSAREHAWHRLGVVLPETFDAADAMRYAKLGGWAVRKMPLQTAPAITAEGVISPLSVPEQFATVRTNPVTGGLDVLGVVGAQYEPIQNEAHAEVLDYVTDESGAHFETAGALRGGRSVFLSMKLPQTMQIGGIDPVDLYLVATNSHDGTSAFRLIVTPVRVVCANTLAAALRRNKGTYSIRHTSGARQGLAEARRALGLTFRFAEEFEAAANRMIDAQIEADEFARVVAEVWPSEPTGKPSPAATDRLRQLNRLRWTSETIPAAIRPTRWGAYNAITEYVDHLSPTRTRTGRVEYRAERSVTGTGPAIKTKAFELLSA